MENGVPLTVQMTYDNDAASYSCMTVTSKFDRHKCKGHGLKSTTSAARFAANRAPGVDGSKKIRNALSFTTMLLTPRGRSHKAPKPMNRAPVEVPTVLTAGQNAGVGVLSATREGDCVSLRLGPGGMPLQVVLSPAEGWGWGERSMSITSVHSQGFGARIKQLVPPVEGESGAMLDVRHLLCPDDTLVEMDGVDTRSMLFAEIIQKLEASNLQRPAPEDCDMNAASDQSNGQYSSSHKSVLAPPSPSEDRPRLSDVISVTSPLSAASTCATTASNSPSDDGMRSCLRSPVRPLSTRKRESRFWSMMSPMRKTRSQTAASSSSRSQISSAWAEQDVRSHESRALAESSVSCLKFSTRARRIKSGAGAKARLPPDENSETVSTKETPKCAGLEARVLFAAEDNPDTTLVSAARRPNSLVCGGSCKTPIRSQECNIGAEDSARDAKQEDYIAPGCRVKEDQSFGMREPSVGAKYAAELQSARTKLSCTSTSRHHTPRANTRRRADTTKAPIPKSRELSQFFQKNSTGHPWSGEDIVRAESISLNGRHRWVRTDGFQQAILIVRNALYILELPNFASVDGDLAAKTFCVSSEDRADVTTKKRRGWYVRSTPSAIQQISLPRSGDEGQRRSSRGLVLHAKSGGCLWIDCTDSDARDALAEVVAAWHRAGTKGKALKICRDEEPTIAESVRKMSKAAITSLLPSREVCWW